MLDFETVKQEKVDTKKFSLNKFLANFFTRGFYAKTSVWKMNSIPTVMDKEKKKMP